MGRARLGLELNDLPEGAPSSRFKTTCATCSVTALFSCVTTNKVSETTCATCSVATLFSCVTTNKRLRNYLCNMFNGGSVQLRN